MGDVDILDMLFDTSGGIIGEQLSGDKQLHQQPQVNSNNMLFPEQKSGVLSDFESADWSSSLDLVSSSWVEVIY